MALRRNGKQPTRNLYSSLRKGHFGQIRSSFDPGRDAPSEQRILGRLDVLLPTREGALSTSGALVFTVIQDAIFWLIMKPFQSVTKLGLLARKYALATNDTAL